MLNINQSNELINNIVFADNIGYPLEDSDTLNWCGGTGAMMSFDYKGKINPCIRYMESSLGKEREPIVIGSINTNDNNEKYLKNLEDLKKITRQSQSTEECLTCPIAAGCGWCSGWNY